MKKDNRKIKELDVGRLRTFRKVGKEIHYTDGSVRIQGHWVNEKEPLELGSIKEPKNTDILKFEISVPSENSERFGKIFDGMFKD